MLEDNDYRALELFFPLGFAYEETWMGYEDEAPLMKIKVQYTAITNRLISNNYSNRW